ncbi:hypothetical protein CAPTEDRAFT_191041 [Capitella teleta]|uniref:Uncharacterized protein n=1 Tax=Capitella teleta TaxID=283909 RepID=R7UWQ6_CAPTE|nr:hypothetical protein CAPTEDRAFT_191041 [Capitella teleta]|eukprot:ELU10677.1 hypothetical protein CAPTEDRAFT_191041 [Capitella teleta]
MEAAKITTDYLYKKNPNRKCLIELQNGTSFILTRSHFELGDGTRLFEDYPEPIKAKSNADFTVEQESRVDDVTVNVAYQLDRADVYFVVKLRWMTDKDVPSCCSGFVETMNLSITSCTKWTNMQPKVTVNSAGVKAKSEAHQLQYGKNSSKFVIRIR